MKPSPARFEVSLAIWDIQHMEKFKDDPLQFKMLIRRYLQNAACLTRLIAVCANEVYQKH